MSNPMKSSECIYPECGPTCRKNCPPLPTKPEPIEPTEEQRRAAAMHHYKLAVLPDKGYLTDWVRTGDATGRAAFDAVVGLARLLAEREAKLRDDIIDDDIEYYKACQAAYSTENDTLRARVAELEAEAFRLRDERHSWMDKSIELSQSLKTALKDVAAFNTVAGEMDAEHAQLKSVIRDLMHQLASTREMHMEAANERDSLLLVSADLEARLKASSEELRQAKAERDSVHGVPASIEAITRAVRCADVDFESVGGSSRHYVSECLLPALGCEGLIIKKKTDVELLPNGDGTSSHYVHTNEQTTRVKS